MKLIVALFLISTIVRGQQYKADKAGPPPPELAAGIVQALEKTGFQITNNSAAYCEIWFRINVPPGVVSKEENVTLSDLTVGSLVGAIRFETNGSDRRGQTIHPGVYTLRYGIMPMNSQHQGAAPQRDFLLLIPAAEDMDLNGTPDFDTLVAMSRKASGTPHPVVLSLRKANADSPGFSQQGDTDWVLQSKIGDTPIIVIVVGAAST